MLPGSLDYPFMISLSHDRGGRLMASQLPLITRALRPLETTEIAHLFYNKNYLLLSLEI
jgi:hypothetical protein